MMVLIGHGSYSLPLITYPFVMIIGNGSLGVSIFFVLSGFLIYNISLREVQKTGTFDWRHFYIRRVLRIFPCFYFFIIVLLILLNGGLIRLSWQTVVSASTFSLNYRHLWDHETGPSDYHVIGHYWTLALEEQFYLLWPLLMALERKRKLLTVLVLVMMLAPLLRVATYFFAPGSRDQIGIMFHTSFDSIAAGVLLGEIFQRPIILARLQILAGNRLVSFGSIAFLTLISPLLQLHFRGAYGITIGRSLELMSLCILITAAVSFPSTMLFRFLNWRPLVFVGVLSYSLYVWNNLFLNAGGRWPLNVFPMNLASAVGMSLISHFLVERPFLKLKSRFHSLPVPAVESQEKSG